MSSRARTRDARVRYALLALSIGLTSSAALASSELEGRIVQALDRRPVAGAEVSILGRSGVAITDAEGRFRWTPAPSPPFEVLVVLPGGHYTRPVLVETLPDSGPLVVEVSPLVEESVTVAGSAPSIESTPVAGTTLLTPREIAVRQPVNLVQLLENVAGVAPVSEGHAAVPAVRGLARGRTVVLIDGARVSTERRAGPSATYLDPFVLAGVEVARGPGSVAYGSDALGGVIAARTRRAAPGSPLRVRFEGSLGAGIPERRAGVELSKGLTRGGLLALVHVRDFDDYRSPDGEVFNSGARDAGVLVRGEHAAGPGTLSAAWQGDFGRDIGRPRNNSTVTRFFYPSEDSHRVTVAYDLTEAGGFSRAGLLVFAGRYAIVTDQDRLATPTRPRLVDRADVSATDLQVRGFGERRVGPARLELGLDVSGRYGLEALDTQIAYDLAGRVTDTRTVVSIERARRTNVGVYGMVEAPLGRRVTVAGGVRGDRVATMSDGGSYGHRSTLNGAFSGFAAATVTLGRGVSIGGQIARGFRDPTLSDRYFVGPSGRGTVAGNPDLEPERSLQYDVAVRYTAPRLRVAAFGYSYRITDLVERYEGTPDSFFFRNRGRARLRGVELEAQIDAGGGLTFDIAAQVSEGRALDEDAPLDDIAPASLSVQVRKALGARAFARVRGALHAGDDRPGPTEARMPAYAVVDVSGGILATDHVELRGLVRNLFDATYPVSPDPRAVSAPGISVLLTTVVRF